VDTFLSNLRHVTHTKRLIAGFYETFFGGDFGEGLVYGLVMIGGAVGLIYAVAKYYS